MATSTLVQKNHGQDPLGTFISQSDLAQILPNHHRSGRLIGRYFSDPREEKIKNIMSTVQDIAALFYERFAAELITEVILQFQSLLDNILEDYEDKYFTKNHIATYFLAVFDYRLAMVGTKLSPKDIEFVRDSMQWRKGKAFSFFSVKKAQRLLLAAGLLKRRNNISFTPLLRTKVAQITRIFQEQYPEYTEKWYRLIDLANDLIDAKLIPFLSVEDSALTIVLSLIPLCVPELNMKVAWQIIREHFVLSSVETYQRRTHRYRKRVRQYLLSGVKKNIANNTSITAGRGVRKSERAILVRNNFRRS